MTSLESSSTGLSSTTSCGSYDQWSQWASRQRRTSRQEAEDLIYGDDENDSSAQKHMELPHKPAAKSSKSLLDDDEGDDNDEQEQPMLLRFLNARKSLLDDDSDDEDDYPLRNNLSCDALFLPPTELRRNREDEDLSRIPSSRSLLSSSVTTPPTPLSKQLSYKNLDTTSLARSPMPLAYITAMTSRRRFSVSRQDALPVV